MRNKKQKFWKKYTNVKTQKGKRKYIGPLAGSVAFKTRKHTDSFLKHTDMQIYKSTGKCKSERKKWQVKGIRRKNRLHWASNALDNAKTC